MGRGGQNRLPREVKKLRGTLKKHREAAPTAVAPPSTVPPPPKKMKASEKAVWLELARQVQSMGCYSDSNYSGFKLLVRTVWMAEEADDYMPPTARVRLVQAANSALCAFGLTPASRSKVHMPEKITEDDTEKDLFGGGLRVVKGGSGG